MPPKKDSGDGSKKVAAGGDGAKKVAAPAKKDDKKKTDGKDVKKATATAASKDVKEKTAKNDDKKKVAGKDGKSEEKAGKKATAKTSKEAKEKAASKDVKEKTTKNDDKKKINTKDGKKATGKEKTAKEKTAKEKTAKDGATPTADGTVAAAPEKQKTVKKVGAKKPGVKSKKIGGKGKKEKVAVKRKLNKNSLHAKKLKLMRKRRFIKFVLKCSEQAKDQVLDVKKLEKFLRDRIKVNEKVHNLSKKVKTKLKDNDVIVLAKPPFAKRYLKYLTRKFLKKNALRDWIRIVAAGSNNYRLSYYKIENPDEEEEKKAE